MCKIAGEGESWFPKTGRITNSGEPRFNYVATRSTESGKAGFLIPPALKALTIFNNNFYLLKINVFNPG